MADADSSRSRIIYRAQAAHGEALPTNPAMNALRFTRDNFKHANATVVSNEIRADRMRSDLRLVGQEVSGGFSFELSADTLDVFLESGVSGAWTTNVLKNGVVAIKEYQFERGLLDVGQYFVYRDCAVNQINLNMPSRNLVTGDITFMGTLGSVSATSMLGTGTLTAVNTNPIVSSGAGINTILVNGVAIGVGVRELNLTINNNLRTREVVDAIASRSPGRGVLDITGNMTVYFANATIYNYFLNNTSFALAFTLSDNVSKRYDIVLPNVKLAEDTIEVTGVDTDILETFNWRALYDSVSGAEIQITRATF